MRDDFGRDINNMRISVTQQCNLDCFYCHHEGENGGNENLRRRNLMTSKEIETIVEIGSRVGIQRLKITGGEPLLRKDIVDIVRAGSKYMKEVSMTTNGVLLGSYAKALRKAGLKRVNVSFDALDYETFIKITGKDAFQEVKDGIAKAIECGLAPVKLNMVVLKGINDRDFSSAIEYASRFGAILQLIEFETNKEDCTSELFRTYHRQLDDVEGKLKRNALDVMERTMHRRRKYILQSENNGRAEVEIVRGMHNSVFCKNCTRLRVTSNGYLKPCLLREDNYIDIITPIRDNASDEELQALFEKAIHQKEPYWR